MNCLTFELLLADFQDGKLEPGEYATAKKHLALCAKCRRLMEIARGELKLLPPEAQSELAHSIIEHTSGPTCARAQLYLCDFVDGKLDSDDTQIVSLHVDHCPGCKALAHGLTFLKEILPQMAEVKPDTRFPIDVLVSTVAWRRLRPGLRTRALEWWNRLIQRPRFSFEAAYVGTLLIVTIAANPLLPLQKISSEARTSIQSRSIAEWAMGSPIKAGAWVGTNVPAVRSAKDSVLELWKGQRAVSQSLDDLRQRSEKCLTATARYNAETAKAYRDGAFSAVQKAWSDLLAFGRELLSRGGSR